MDLFWRLLNPILPWALQRRPDDEKFRPDELDLHVVDGGRHLSGAELFKKVRLENDAESAREVIEFQRRIGEKSSG